MANEEIIYIEPFVGGGAMLFYMLQQYHTERIKEPAYLEKTA